ncbi:hypothetical protein C8J57DRAFT_1675344, partial [Mycena rebaudengoi]
LTLHGAQILAAAAPYFPSEYTLHIAISLVAVVTPRSQRRTTTCERDPRIYMPELYSSTLVEALAVRGAHIIVLIPSIDTSAATTCVDLLRSTAASDTRSSAFGGQGEARGICERGSAYGRMGKGEDQREREQGALATFLLTTLLILLLPVAAPVERDIRIANVVNHFCAIATASPALFLSFSSFSPLIFSLPPHSSSAKARGPSAPPSPCGTSNASSNRSPPHRSSQKFNLVAATVSPGISPS